MGGIETFLYDLNEELYNTGHSIQSDILSFNNTNKTETDSTRPYLIQRSAEMFKFKKVPISINYLGWLRKHQNNYDIIHLHFPNPWADLTLILSGFKGKVVVHWHSDIVKSKLLKSIYDPLMRWMLKRSDLIIATSPNYAAESDTLPDYKEKLKVVPLGLNPDRIKTINSDTLAKLQKQYKGKKVVFSLGRQIPYKGFDYLIKAAQHLPDDYKVLIGGRGELYEEHKELIESHQLSDKVEMIGFIKSEDLSSYYNLCDVYVMSSVFKSEAFGVVQLEAMYFKKPIVSTKIPCSGVSWVNQHEETGLIVPPKDEKALATAIKSIIEDGKYDTYSQNCTKRLNTHFSSVKTANEIYHLYKGLLNE
jgi:rhamnosyl/mannosyltransferase